MTNNQKKEINYMDDARQFAAECWCNEETKDKAMDATLAEAVSKRIACWMEVAAMHQRNEEFYRSLIVRCGKAIGKRAYIQDDGNICDEVLCIKVPEIIEADYRSLSNEKRKIT